MAIQKLKKVTLLGNISDKSALLHDLQKLGVMHIIPLSDSEQQLRRRPRDYYDALKYLIDCPEQRTPIMREEAFDAEAIVKAALENQAETRKVRNERDKLEKKLPLIKNWGDFEFPNPDEFGGRQFFFYKVPSYKLKKLAKNKAVTWQQLHIGNRNAYIVVIAKEKPASNVIPGSFEDIGPESLSELTLQIENLTIRLEDLQDERQRLTRWVPMLLRNLNRAEDITMRNYVSDRTLDEDGYFGVQGWVTEKDLPQLDLLNDRYTLAKMIENPANDDTPPTLFKNKESIAAGENLVEFYQMPGYNTWDPSIILYFSFAVFFAMILSDAGYAAILALIMLAVWGKLEKDATTRRMRRMGLLISVVSFVYGALVGSYFGVTPGVPLIEKVQIFDVTDFDMMMKLSILTGAAHIFLANLIMAWQNRHSTTALSYVGWMAIFIGAIGLWLINPQHIPSRAVAIAGAVAVVLFTSARPFKGVKNIILRFVDGILGLANISKAFGDTLSYMRLFALGLASASLAVMFNGLAGQVAEGIAGIGTFLAIIVLIFGHSLNLILGIMGGVVHGLRLNLIEFFSWSIADEGYAFKPFHLKEK